MECLICVLIMYRPLRQFANMYVGSLGNLLLFLIKVVCIAINYIILLFCKFGNLIVGSMPLD